MCAVFPDLSLPSYLAWSCVPPSSSTWPWCSYFSIPFVYVHQMATIKAAYFIQSLLGGHAVPRFSAGQVEGIFSGEQASPDTRHDT